MTQANPLQRVAGVRRCSDTLASKATSIAACGAPATQRYKTVPANPKAPWRYACDACMPKIRAKRARERFLVQRLEPPAP